MDDNRYQEEMAQFLKELDAFEQKVKQDLEAKKAPQLPIQKPLSKQEPTAQTPPEPSIADRWFEESKHIDWSKGADGAGPTFPTEKRSATDAEVPADTVTHFFEKKEPFRQPAASAQERSARQEHADWQERSARQEQPDQQEWSARQEQPGRQEWSARQERPDRQEWSDRQEASAWQARADRQEGTTRQAQAARQEDVAWQNQSAWQKWNAEEPQEAVWQQQPVTGKRKKARKTPSPQETTWPEIPTEALQPEENPESVQITKPKKEKQSKKEKQNKKGKKKKPWTKTKKILMSIICILLVLLLSGGIFLWSKLNMIHTGGQEWDAVDTQENDIDAAAIDSITDAASLTAWLKKWHNNGGDKMSSKYVKNVLLLGVDSESSLSDTMMLVSINRRTKQVSMVSFYRDSYTYIKRPNGKESYAKLNAAYRYGGAELVRSTIENNYKIKIDEYAVVDYETFPKIVDALGGVTVNVTEKEANYLNKTWWKWTRTGKKISFQSGNMKMDGEHALMYCRIRKLDSDVNRTERQRKVINACIDKAKGASASQLNKSVNAVFPYLTTSMTKTKIISYGTQALSEGWINWTRKQSTMPTDEYCLPGYAGTQWIWLCDYEGSAYELQMQLYGQSNISLAKNRISPLSFSSSYSGKTAASTKRNGSGSQTAGKSETKSSTKKSSSTHFGDDLVEEPSASAKSTSSTTSKTRRFGF